ncbi:hypothetical protein F383_35943 [Gossypium arboreum]|uniref:Uncharacterized protein n=1 Tax=Gossypium arboreum TaxID=29729 RepID=A0A0B0Q2F6_GOSAR|nr:hypothetical protein F383_35943 [Gossypium arboreum]
MYISQSIKQITYTTYRSLVSS